MKQTTKSREKRSLLKEAAQDGRGNDSMMAHVAKGEIVIPVELANHPEVRKMLSQGFESLGTSIDRYTVGHESNSKNPETGEAEFFSLKQFAGTIIGGTIGWVASGGNPVVAMEGAKIGAGVDVTRAAVSNAQAAREQAAQAQAQALEAARQAREQAAQQSQAALSQAAADAAASRQIQIDALNAQKSDAASRLQQLQLSSEQQASLMQNLTAQQQAAANAAMLQLNEQQKQYQEQKLAMEKAAAEQAAALQEERRKIAERESAQMTARRRSGRRSLLSEARLTAEVGVMGQEEAPKVLLGA
jgi:hypothetical protein